jgi:hypothetical protein
LKTVCARSQIRFCDARLHHIRRPLCLEIMGGIVGQGHSSVRCILASHEYIKHHLMLFALLLVVRIPEHFSKTLNFAGRSDTNSESDAIPG